MVIVADGEIPGFQQASDALAQSIRFGRNAEKVAVGGERTARPRHFSTFEVSDVP
jgi:hypothetical protein